MKLKEFTRICNCTVYDKIVILTDTDDPDNPEDVTEFDTSDIMKCVALFGKYEVVSIAFNNTTDFNNDLEQTEIQLYLDKPEDILQNEEYKKLHEAYVAVLKQNTFLRQKINELQHNITMLETAGK